MINGIDLPMILPTMPCRGAQMLKYEGERAMTEETFLQQFEELSAQIDQLPVDQQPRLRKLAEETLLRYQTNKTNIDQANAALDDWRLQVKYQIFDAEASLRERQQKLGGE